MTSRCIEVPESILRASVATAEILETGSRPVLRKLLPVKKRARSPSAPAGKKNLPRPGQRPLEPGQGHCEETMNRVGQRIEVNLAAPVVDIVEPSGRTVRWPTFGGRLRFTPTQPGRYQIGAVTFDVQPAPFAGYIRWGRNRQHFAYDNGDFFFPIGANFCWPNMNNVFVGQKLDDLFLMLRKLRAAGGNAYRLWANATWAGQTIDWGCRFGEFNEAGCSKLDAIVEESERLGLGIMFCIDAMNVWAGNKIEKSSYAQENGGPCRNTWDYFNLPAARAMTREKMRYVAARWGYSPAIWCWEFWNEIDGCNLDKVTPHSMLAWHQEMAQALRAADPVGHIITTSCGHPLDFPAMWRIPELEFTQTHHYGYKDSVDDIVPFLRGYHDTAMKLWGKPHTFGELGITWCGPGVAGGSEKDGRTLHNVLWSTALLPGACGAGLYWSWDGYIHKNDLYQRFTGLAKFLEGERWHEHAVTAQPVDLAGPTRTYNPPVTLKVPTCLSGTDYVQSTFTIRHDGSVPEGNHLIPNLFHGQDQPLYRFRITLNVDYRQAGDFTVMVWGGGANMMGGGEIVAKTDPVAELRLDGQVALSRPVNLKKPAGDDYCDRLTIRVPAGRHEIAIENIGGGVFHTGHYLLEGYLEQRTLADAQAIRVGDRAFVWVRNTEYNWATPKPEPIRGVTLRLPGWDNATVEWWDTDAGQVLRTDIMTGGVIAVPEFHQSIAAKVKPT
jgi:hypothetical protein